MGNNYKITYNVDMVFCFDMSANMSEIINNIRNNISIFYEDIALVMEKRSKILNRLRVRIIAFRNFVENKDGAIFTTDFFDLPEQKGELKEYLKKLQLKSGVNTPCNGLEALGYAIKSNWNTEGMKKKQVIVVWSDNITHDLGYGKSMPDYPEWMAKDFNELTAWWGDKHSKGFIDQNAKRLLLFAPDGPHWSSISSFWDNVIHFTSAAGSGLCEFDFPMMYEAIINTVCKNIWY